MEPANTLHVIRKSSKEILILNPETGDGQTLRADATVEIGTTIVEFLEGKKLAAPRPYRDTSNFRQGGAGVTFSGGVMVDPAAKLTDSEGGEL